MNSSLETSNLVSNHRSNAHRSSREGELEGFSSDDRELLGRGGGGHTGAAEVRSRLAWPRRTLAREVRALDAARGAMGDAGAMSGGTTDTVSAKGDDVSCERASGVQDLPPRCPGRSPPPPAPRTPPRAATAGARATRPCAGGRCRTSPRPGRGRCGAISRPWPAASADCWSTPRETHGAPRVHLRVPAGGRVQGERDERGRAAAEQGRSARQLAQVQQPQEVSRLVRLPAERGGAGLEKRVPGGRHADGGGADHLLERILRARRGTREFRKRRAAVDGQVHVDGGEPAALRGDAQHTEGHVSVVRGRGLLADSPRTRAPSREALAEGRTPRTARPRTARPRTARPSACRCAWRARRSTRSAATKRARSRRGPRRSARAPAALVKPASRKWRATPRSAAGCRRAASRSCWLVFELPPRTRRTERRACIGTRTDASPATRSEGTRRVLGGTISCPWRRAGDDLTASVDAEIVEGGGTGFLEGPDGRAVFSVSFHAAREACEARTHHRRADACVGPVTAILAPDGAVRATGGVPDGKLGSGEASGSPTRPAGGSAREARRRGRKTARRTPRVRGGVSGGVSGEGPPLRRRRARRGRSVRVAPGQLHQAQGHPEEAQDVRLEREEPAVFRRRLFVPAHRVPARAEPPPQSPLDVPGGGGPRIVGPKNKQRRRRVRVSPAERVQPAGPREERLARVAEPVRARREGLGMARVSHAHDVIRRRRGVFSERHRGVHRGGSRVARKERARADSKERTPPPTNQMRSTRAGSRASSRGTGWSGGSRGGALSLRRPLRGGEGGGAGARGARRGAHREAAKETGAPKLELGALLATDIRDARTQEVGRGRALREALGGRKGSARASRKTLQNATTGLATTDLAIRRRRRTPTPTPTPTWRTCTSRRPVGADGERQGGDGREAAHRVRG